MEPPRVPVQRDVVAVEGDDEGQIESLDIGKGIHRASRKVGVDEAESHVAKPAEERGAVPGDTVRSVRPVNRVERKPLEVFGTPTKYLGLVSLVIDELLIDEGLRVGEVVCVENRDPRTGLPRGTEHTLS